MASGDLEAAVPRSFFLGRSPGLWPGFFTVARPFDGKWRKTLLHSGQIAPDFKLNTVDGQRISLSERLEGKSHLLLVFLRHLG
jgi:hypothetical protein